MTELIPTPKDHLTIAVASDLHAFENDDLDDSPSHLRITNSESELGRHPIAGLINLIETEGLTADLLLCPGDIGDKAQAVGIQYGWKAIHAVGAKLGTQLITASSGNHDLDSRYLSSSSSDAKGMLLGLDPPYPLPDEVSNNKYWARNYVIKDSENFRLLILNSCAYHGGAPDEIKHGRIADSTLSFLKRELATLELKPINILLCHHHPQQHMEINLGDYDVMKNGQLLLDLLGSGDFGRWLIIHGHKHHPKITYAAGGGSSPVIFSAGSLCANLYLELQTQARNQFYLITLPFEDIANLGLVGFVQAWDWAAGDGWAPAGPKSGLSSWSSFGFRGDPRLLAGKISHIMNGEKAQWKTISDAIPEINYLLPQDLSTLKHELETNHGLKIVEEEGQPKQIGKPL